MTSDSFRWPTLAALVAAALTAALASGCFDQTIYPALQIDSGVEDDGSSDAGPEPADGVAEVGNE